jgi:uncharacterized protein HemX
MSQAVEPLPASDPAPPSTPEALAPPRLIHRGSGAWVWVLAVAVLAAAGLVVALRLAALQRELRGVQRHSEEIATLHASDLAERQALQERIDATVRRTEQLEQQLTLLAGRDVAADAELRRLREEHVLSEVDELLTLAGSQLQVTRDPNSAISALASADARLARVPRPQFFALREALARDIERLRKTPVVDVAGTAIRIDRLVQGVDSWHLLADPTRHLAAPPAHPKTDAAAPPPPKLGWLQRELGDTLRDLVRIRTVEAPDSLLLPPDQQPLLREHLRVRLLMARQSMLTRNQLLFRADLSDAQALISRYFDPTDPLVGAGLAQIKALSSAAIDVPMPTLDDSLAALRAARPTP